MRVLVTGGAGFVGSHVVDTLLERGHTTAVLDDFSTGDLRNLGVASSLGLTSVFWEDVVSPATARLVTEWRPEVIIHLAGQTSASISIEDPLADARANIVGTINVARSAVDAGVRKIVFAASCAIYGEVDAVDLPIREGQYAKPNSPYAVSKAAALEYLRHFHRRCGLTYSALVLGNVYGPRQSSAGGAVIATMADALRRRRPVVIHGDGRQTRDFVYVTDVADAFARSCHKGDGRVLNIGTGDETGVERVYQILCEHLGVSGEPRRTSARAAEPRRSALDSGAAREVLGWQATTSLRVGLCHVLDYL